MNCVHRYLLDDTPSVKPTTNKDGKKVRAKVFTGKCRKCGKTKLFPVKSEKKFDNALFLGNRQHTQYAPANNVIF